MCRSRTVVFKEYTREYKCVISVVLCFQAACFSLLLAFFPMGFNLSFA